MSRRVALDALVLGPEAGGLGVYIDKLIDYFARTRSAVELGVYISKRTFASYRERLGADLLRPVAVSPTNPIQRLLAEPFVWRRLMKHDAIDLFHSPMSYVPLGVSIPAVVTIHDMRAFHYPESYSLARRTFLRSMIARSARGAVKIFASSEFTKSDITSALEVDPAKIVVIHLGLDREAFERRSSPEDWARMKERLALPDE